MAAPQAGDDWPNLRALVAEAFSEGLDETEPISGPTVVDFVAVLLSNNPDAVKVREWIRKNSDRANWSTMPDAAPCERALFGLAIRCIFTRPLSA